jgi:hypothetical protein
MVELPLVALAEPEPPLGMLWLLPWLCEFELDALAGVAEAVAPEVLLALVLPPVEVVLPPKTLLPPVLAMPALLF